MVSKVFKRADVSRSMQYQDDKLAPVVPGWPDVAVFIDLHELDVVLRPSTRKIKNELYTTSIALLADTEEAMRERVKQINKSGMTLHCAEEDQVWKTPIPTQPAIIAWKDARKTGAAKRGAAQSAESKKAKTKAALKLIEEDLKRPSGPGNTTRELLDRVGVKSVNSIKDHYGINRETMQSRYQAELKRKRRRELYRAERQKEGARV